MIWIYSYPYVYCSMATEFSNEHIRGLINRYGENHAVLARYLGITVGTFNNKLKGNENKRFSAEEIHRLFVYFRDYAEGILVSLGNVPVPVEPVTEPVVDGGSLFPPSNLSPEQRLDWLKRNGLFE